MKKIFLIMAFSSFCGIGIYAADTTHAQEAVKNAAQASGNASASAAHSIAATGQVTSAVSAIPLKISGATGAVSAKAGDSLAEAANTPIGTPLTVTDDVVTVGPPPNEALKAKKQ